jgi:hypothetical protein
MGTSVLRARDSPWADAAVEALTCDEGWAVGTMVQGTDGVGSVLFHRVSDVWTFRYAAGSYRAFCEASIAAGAPSTIVQDCGTDPP